MSQRRGSYVASSKEKTKSNYPLYKFINALPNKWSGIHLELLEDFPCDTKDQLLAREGVWIRRIGTLNHGISGRTNKEYYQDHKNERCEYIRDRHQNLNSPHREAYLAYQKAYQSVRFTCPHCNKEMSRRCIEEHISRHEV